MNDAIHASLGSTINAVRDILRGAQTEDLEAVVRWRPAVLDGHSADDLQQLGSMLAQDEPLFGSLPLPGDIELADDWRAGEYPYRNLMSCKAYERDKQRRRFRERERHPLKQWKLSPIHPMRNVLHELPYAVRDIDHPHPHAGMVHRQRVGPSGRGDPGSRLVVRGIPTDNDVPRSLRGERRTGRGGRACRKLLHWA